MVATWYAVSPNLHCWNACTAMTLTGGGGNPDWAAEHEPAVTSRSGWIIQIGATDSEAGAKKLLDKARSTGHRALASAEPFTERVTKGDATLFRARFAGFDRDRAEAACKVLKRNEIACLALKN